MKSGLAYSLVAASLLAASPAAAFTVTFFDRGVVATDLGLGLAPTSTTGAYLAETTGTALSPSDRRSPYQGISTLLEDTAKYRSLGSPSGGQTPALPASATYSIAGTSMSFLWGSPDTYNLIEFLAADNSVLGFVSGNSIPAAFINRPSTACTAMFGCGYANVRLVTDAPFAAVRLSTTNIAFEHAALVPLPAAAWFVLTALAGLGAYYRRFGRPAHLAAA